MKRRRFTEKEIFVILKESDQGIPIADLCRKYGMSSASFYKWRSKYGGLSASKLSEMKVLEAEHKRLKRMYAELHLQHDLLKEALEKKW